MTDHFLLLNLSRHPWVDLNQLKEHFLELSAQFHPDRFHDQPDSVRREATEKFSALNSANNCLRSPKDRLRHLLELERAAKPVDIQQVPSDLMSLFFEIGQLIREVDELLKSNATASSPMLKVKQFEENQIWVTKLTKARQDVDLLRDNLNGELESLTADWRTQSLDRLKEMYRLFGYYDRWIAQLQERIGRLSFS